MLKMQDLDGAVVNGLQTGDLPRELAAYFLAPDKAGKILVLERYAEGLANRDGAVHDAIKALDESLFAWQAELVEELAALAIRKKDIEDQLAEINAQAIAPQTAALDVITPFANALGITDVKVRLDGEFGVLVGFGFGQGNGKSGASKGRRRYFDTDGSPASTAKELCGRHEVDPGKNSPVRALESNGFAWRTVGGEDEKGNYVEYHLVAV